MSISNRKSFGAAGTLALLQVSWMVLGPMSHAIASEQAYLEALQIADRYVQKKKALADPANSLSTSMVKQLFGRFYQVGDTWEVAALRLDSGMTRKTAASISSIVRSDAVGIFRYRVVQVKTGASPEVTVEVSQREGYGTRIVDPKVKTITLTMNDQLKESSKAYAMVSGEAIHASQNEIKTRVSSLELFPLDVPDVATADRVETSSAPELPEVLKKIAQQSGYNPDLSRSTWYDQDDFFGRSVQILWQQGNPWPTYLRTSYGIAILINKETS